VSKKIQEILQNNYSHNNNGVNTNLARIMSTGSLAGTGKIVILPVDQGFEHGPDRSFMKNPEAYNPAYLFKLAIETGMNAYAAPIGSLEAAMNDFTGQIPLILKVNSSSVLCPKSEHPTQSWTASVDDALKIGASAIGLTIYPASGKMLDMINDAREVVREAKSKGLAAIVWSYARGEDLPKEHETSLDVINYSAHIAALIGADIIKVKPPIASIFDKEAKKVFEGVAIDSLSDRIKLVKRACFDGKRIVIFSGGVAKGENEVLEEIKAINHGGGDGSIIGRNAFQRTFADAKSLISKIQKIYQS
jgi:class I fructose-bisphosphate aldolase